MYHNYVFNEVNEALPALLRTVLAEGATVPSRAGGTKELTHVGITLREPWHRELLLTARKANVAAQVAETMWVLAGRDDVEWLARYLPRATDFSDDGKVWRAGYGARLRRWPGRNFSNTHDQLAYVVATLRNDPGSRQAVMSIWDPVVDTTPGKDVPCNDWLHFLCRDGKLDLHVAVRSNDAIWGWSGINQFEWSALLEVVAGLVGVQVGALHFAVTSWHLYEHHYTKAGRIVAAWDVEIARVDLAGSPRFTCNRQDGLVGFDELCQRWFELEEAIRKGRPVSDAVDEFPEPMMRSWLRVLQWWWTGNHTHLHPLEGTRLARACELAVQPSRTIPTHERGSVGVDTAEFVRYVTKLHNEKHAAYGDSWCRRGEMLGIMANIARKVDRLGGGETADETAADTAIDLLVYLAKYSVWLWERSPEAPWDAEGAGGDPSHANATIRDLERHSRVTQTRPELYLIEQFDVLEKAVMAQDPERRKTVDAMLPAAFNLAYSRWLATR